MKVTATVKSWPDPTAVIGCEIMVRNSDRFAKSRWRNRDQATVISRWPRIWPLARDCECSINLARVFLFMILFFGYFFYEKEKKIFKKNKCILEILM